MRLERRRPELSVVVVVYNIPREAPRTLLSLSADYQRHLGADEYEVIVVDNGSDPPLDPNIIKGLSGSFRLLRIDPAPASPAHAINRGLAQARGDIIGVMIDGARLVTPGLLHFARHGARLFERAVVTTLGWHLGADLQAFAIDGGYDQAREDALLASIGWPQDGYRLFEISTLDGASVDGWFRPSGESNALFLGRTLWEELGGVDERFDAPGGGFLNQDTLRRALDLRNTHHVVLLGEGSFHQLHGGVATNTTNESFSDKLKSWRAQYQELRGRRYARTVAQAPRTYVGTLPSSMLPHFIHAAIHPVSRGEAAEPPPGVGFDRGLRSNRPSVRSADARLAAVVDLALAEFKVQRFEACAAVARLIRSRAPDEPEPLRLLSLIGGHLGRLGPRRTQLAPYHLALGEAHRLLGNSEAAESHYRQALRINSDLPTAHIGLAALRMPGPNHYDWLDRLHAALVPETFIEIGIGTGASLTRALPPTRVIGVDPVPNIKSALRTETHIFAKTSDRFFARRRPARLLRGQPLGLGFIDGLHLYEQALRDFINLEVYCGPKSVVLLHDTVPLDEPTQSRDQKTKFYTGDVWKIVPCLKHYRPDLDIFTIATPPSGLTVVTGLDRTSHVLSDAYEEAVARFVEIPFGAVEGRLDAMLNMVPNDWSVVEARFKARGIL